MKNNKYYNFFHIKNALFHEKQNYFVRRKAENFQEILKDIFNDLEVQIVVSGGTSF
jgi:hypothetical protein